MGRISFKRNSFLDSTKKQVAKICNENALISILQLAASEDPDHRMRGTLGHGRRGQCFHAKTNMLFKLDGPCGVTKV